MSITVDGSANTITSSAASISVTKPIIVTSIQNTPIGSTTPSTGAFTTLSANSFSIPDQGTFSAAAVFNNTGGQYIVGVNNSAGNQYGNTPYSLCIYAPSGKIIETVIAGSTISTFSSTGLAVTGAISATTTIKTGGYTVATLPAGTTGDRAHVTDATAPTYLGALTGGGAVVCPVFKNASAWVSA